MKIAVFLILAFCSAAPALANSRPEQTHLAALCQEMGGTTEYVLHDRMPVDCLTEEYAIAAGLAPAWAESIGRSLYHAFMTGRKPGVMLILREPQDQAHLNRLRLLGIQYNVMVWSVSLESEQHPSGSEKASGKL